MIMRHSNNNFQHEALTLTQLVYSSQMACSMRCYAEWPSLPLASHFSLASQSRCSLGLRTTRMDLVCFSPPGIALSAYVSVVLLPQTLHFGLTSQLFCILKLHAICAHALFSLLPWSSAHIRFEWLHSLKLLACKKLLHEKILYSFDTKSINCKIIQNRLKRIQTQQGAFRECRHLYVCDLWPWRVTLTLCH